jgi:RNA recognition motif-containing protein
MQSLFVGNIPYQATEAELEAMFLQFGFKPRSVRIIQDRETGQSRGFGFVELADDTERNRAKTLLDGQLLNGRSLAIRDADSKPPSSRGRDGGSGGPQQALQNSAPPPDPRHNDSGYGHGERKEHKGRSRRRRDDDSGEHW